MDLFLRCLDFNFDPVSVTRAGKNLLASNQLFFVLIDLCPFKQIVVNFANG